MSGLNSQDMEILRSYAARGNRELYWNYLAQKEGADGYGLLALGVVRNDSMPGAVANHFADNRAQWDGRQLSERDWERFGEDLISRDFALRSRQMERHRPDLALNLPVDDVQRAHDGAFNQAGIDPNAWTPRQLLDAARRQGGTQEAERVWGNMLDSRGFGLLRTGITGWDVSVRYNDEVLPATRYLGALTGAGVLAAADRSRTDPDVIGNRDHYHQYDRVRGQWSAVHTSESDFSSRLETDAGTLRELNDARAIRLESQAQRDDFHPADPNRHRPIARSPFTIADAGDVPDRDARSAAVDATSGRSPQHAAVGGQDVPAPAMGLAGLGAIDRALFDRIRRDVPPGIADERVAEAMLAAKQGQIGGAHQVERVAAVDDRILILGTMDTGAARVALGTTHAATPLADTVQQANTLNQQQGEQARVAAVQREGEAPVRA